MNLNQMTRIAGRSNHKLYSHCAMIFAGNRLLSYGYNFNEIHAEVSAIRRLTRIFRVDNSRRPANLHLVSFMVKRRTGFIGNSYPCPRCIQEMLNAGIRTFTYFNGEKICQIKL